MKSPLLKIPVVALIVGMVCAGVIFVAQLAQAATPPYEPDPQSNGTLTFFDAAGHVKTTGSITDAPFANFVQATAPSHPTGDSIATLFGCTPQVGQPTGNFPCLQMTASTNYPNPAAPAPLNSSPLPLVTLTPDDFRIADLQDVQPNTAPPGDPLNGLYQLRVQTSAPGVPFAPVWAVADIFVSGDTWTQVYPTPAPPAQADLSVTKTDSPDPVTTGGTLTYTMTATNNGPDPATGVVVTDTLPAGVAFQSASSGCTNASGTVTCTIGNLASSSSGATATATITVTAPSTASTITNTAKVAGNENDPVAGNNSATADTTVNAPAPAQADLSITKTDSPDPVTTGGTLTYTLTVKNNGPDAATGVTATDTLPAGVAFVSASSGCANASGTVTCTIGNLASGASSTATITVTAPADPGTITNEASVSATETDPNMANNMATADTTVNAPAPAQADLSITKTDSPDPVETGGMLTYTINVTNNGPDAAAGVVVTDTPPAGVTFQSASSGCTNTAGTVTCTVGDLANGDSASLTITVKAPATAGAVSNTAKVATTTSDPKPANNSATATTTVTAPTQARADLSITKTDSPDPVQAGGRLTYTLTVKNNGPDTATGVVVSDTLPAGVTFVSASSTKGSCVNASGTVTCSIGTLNRNATVTITVKVTATMAGAITNTATVSGAQTDPKPENNTATAKTTVKGKADLSIRKTASPIVVKVGSPVTYTLTVKNHGPSQATNVVTTDSLPSGMTFVSATPSQGSCSLSGSTVTCNLGTIAAGGTATVKIVTRPTRVGLFFNRAAVKAAEPDPRMANNESWFVVLATRP